MKLKHLFLIAIPFLVLSGCSKADDDTPAAPHDHVYSGDWVKDQNDHWKVCDVTNCDEVSERAAHTFVLKQGSHQDATCEHPALDTYECSVCGYSKIVESGNKEAHSYVKSIKSVATCQTDGVYKFTCQDCGDSFEQEYHDHDAHNFKKVATAGNVETYKCQNSGCNEQYTIINASTQASAQVTASDLQDAGAIKLKHADIAFEESALADFSENVTISAEPKAVAEIEVSDDVKAKIGDNTIIDFSFKDGDETVSNFNGALTITLPYTLKEGEDPEGIVIWYLADGIATPIEAKYRDGFVKFETTHFSLYTVVHLTVKEVCESFGHNYGKERKVESTCVDHGYADHICTRCAFTDREVLPLVAHQWEYSSKSEATHAHDGYIEYKCAVCKDTYRSTIEKLPENSQGFYLTLLKTFLNNDISFEGTETFGSMDVKVEGYKGTDLEGIPFVYARVPLGPRVYEVGQYKGFNLNTNFRRTKASSSFVNAFSNIGTIFAQFPNSVDDIVQKIGVNYIEKFFTKSEIPEGYSFSINKEKIEAIFDVVESGTLGQLVTEVMGEEGYDKIMEWVEKAYNKTIAEVIEELGTKGYVVKELYNAANSIMQIVTQKAETPLPDFDELYNQYKDQTIIGVVTAMMAGKNSSSQGGQVTEYIPEGISMPDGVSMPEGISMPEGYPMGGGEAAPSMIPSTYQEAKAMIDEYLEMKVLDLYAQFGSMMGGSKGGAIVHMAAGASQSGDDTLEIIEMIEQAREMMDKVECSFIAGSNGDFISASIAAKDISAGQLGGMTASLTLDVKKGFDKHEICEYLSRYNKYAEGREKAYNISSSNFDWFVKPYQETFDTEFEYFPTYGNINVKGSYFEEEKSYSAIVSKGYAVKNLRVYDEKTGESITVDAQLVLILRDPDEVNGYGYLNLVQNQGGLGTKLGLNEYGLLAGTNDLTEAIFLRYKTSASEEPINEYIGRYFSEYKYRFSYLYNLDQAKYEWTRGSFDYLDAHSYRYELTTVEEYCKYENIPVEAYGDVKGDMIFIKKTCEDCGQIEVDSRGYNKSAYENEVYVGETAFLNKNMDDTALESYKYFANMDVYYNGRAFTYRFDYYDISQGQSLYPDNYTQTGNKVTVTFGNAKLEMVYKDVTECKVNYNLTYYVNNEVVRTLAYQEHSSTSYTPVTHVYETPCYTTTTYTKRCNHCGREYHVRTEVNVHHTGTELVKSVDRTTTHDGLKIYHCRTCDACWCEEEYVCQHWNGSYNERTGQFECPDCGYKVTSEVLPSVYVEKITDKNSTAYVEGYETYSYNLSGRYPWSNEYIGSRELSHQMTVCYVENGEVVEVPGLTGVNGKATSSWEVINVTIGNNTIGFGFHMNIVRFKTSDIQTMMESARSLAPGKTLYYAIKSVRNIMIPSEEDPSQMILPVYYNVLN